jgi:ABC-type antimicrobial peptide transport system permease subunit
MMRALGLGNDEVRKIIIHEGVLYGIASGGIGITLGAILTYLIYIVGTQIISQGLVWKFPTVTIVITYIIVIIICLISSMIPSRGLFKSSIVDSIRAVE